MTDLTATLLEALRKRARLRNKVRDEIRADSRARKGPSRDYAQMPTWNEYQRAEVALNATLTAWEESEGIVDP